MQQVGTKEPQKPEQNSEEQASRKRYSRDAYKAYMERLKADPEKLAKHRAMARARNKASMERLMADPERRRALAERKKRYTKELRRERQAAADKANPERKRERLARRNAYNKKCYEEAKSDPAKWAKEQAKRSEKWRKEKENPSFHARRRARQQSLKQRKEVVKQCISPKCSAHRYGETKYCEQHWTTLVVTNLAKRAKRYSVTLSEADRAQLIVAVMPGANVRCAYSGAYLTAGKNLCLEHVYPVKTHPHLAANPLNLRWCHRTVNAAKLAGDPRDEEMLSIFRPDIAQKIREAAASFDPDEPISAAADTDQPAAPPQPSSSATPAPTPAVPELLRLVLAAQAASR